MGSKLHRRGLTPLDSGPTLLLNNVGLSVAISLHLLPMSRRALVPIADGTEEIEAVCVIDTLRRADVEVTVASVSSDTSVVCSRGLKVQADRLLGDISERELELFDAVVLPGGLKGAEAFRDCATLVEIVRRQLAAGRILGAICASPYIVLATHGIIGAESLATCHPNFEDKMPNKQKIHSRVVVDGALFTSRGPGTSLEFALTLVQRLCGAGAAERLARGMVVAWPHQE